jgi:hypothetical protein
MDLRNVILPQQMTSFGLAFSYLLESLTVVQFFISLCIDSEVILGILCLQS